MKGNDKKPDIFNLRPTYNRVEHKREISYLDPSGHVLFCLWCKGL